MDKKTNAKLTKETKMNFIIAFIVIFCIVLIGGVLIAVNSREEQPVQPAESTFSFLTVSQIEQTNPPAALPSATLTPAPAVPVTPPSTGVSAVTTAEAPTQPASTAPVSETTNVQLTHFNIDADNLTNIGKLLFNLGFVYNAKENMFYSPNDPWQRNMGYSSLYDDFAVVADMYFDTVRFKFKYGDKNWMYQIWKGRYGATCGCEMGVYYQDKRTNNKQFYDVPTDDDPLPGMYFELYRYGDYLFKNGPARHWWLTGFRLLDSSGSEALLMKMKYFMPNKEMCDAFEVAVKQECDARANLSYSREENTISLEWAY